MFKRIWLYSANPKMRPKEVSKAKRRGVREANVGMEVEKRSLFN